MLNNHHQRTSSSGPMRDDHQVYLALLKKYHDHFAQFLHLERQQERDEFFTSNAPENQGRQKLLKLNDPQFRELSADVYDEMQRRLANGSQGPYLADDARLHQKRNMARRKLAVLSDSRYANLAMDILYDLERRYPDFRGDIGMGTVEATAPFDHPESGVSNGDSKPIVANKSPSHLRPFFESPQNGFLSTDQHAFDSFSREIGQELHIDVGSPTATTPATVQNVTTKTIIPEKSTLVEEDDDDEDDDELRDSFNDERGSLEGEHESLPSEVHSSPGELDKDSSANLHHEDSFKFDNSRQSVGLHSIAEESEHSDDMASHSPTVERRIPSYSNQRRPSDSHVRNFSLASEPLSFVDSENAFNVDSSDSHLYQSTIPPQSSAFSPNSSITQEREAANSTPQPNDKTAAAFSQLTGEKASDNRAHSNYTDELREKDEHIQMLVDEGSRLDECINKLESQLADSEALKNTLTEENGRLHDLVGQLEQQKNDVSRQLAELKEKYETLQHKAMNNDSDLASSQMKHLDLLEQMKRKSADLATLQAEHENLKSQYKGALVKHTELSDTSNSLTQQLSNLRSDLHASNGQLEESKQKVAALEASLVAAQSQPRAAPTPPLSSHEEKTPSRSIGEVAPLTKEHEQLKAKYEQLQIDNRKLGDELLQQQKVTEQVREEASAFLEEMKQLAQSPSWGNADQLVEQNQQLKMEIQEWKSRYSKAKTQVRNLRSSSYTNPIFSSSTANSAPYVSNDGKLRDVTVTKFQVAMDEFMAKSRSDPQNLLANLHEVILATRGITNDLRNDTRGGLHPQVSQKASDVEKTANQLIVTAKNFATSTGLFPVSILDATSSDLSSSIIELIKIVKIRPTEGELQTSPVMKKDPSRTSPQMTRTTNFSREPIAPVDGLSFPKTRNKKPIVFNVRNPENTLVELQAYLEEKSSEIADRITSILSGIKSTDNNSDLVPKLEDLMMSIGTMIDASSNAASQTKGWQLKEHISWIVENLKDCNHRVSAIKEASANLDQQLSPDRHTKQRIAAVCHDMAKCSKELVKTVEEVSMRPDIDITV